MGQSLPGLRWEGADVDAGILAEARQRPLLRHDPLHHLSAGHPLPFADNAFDAVTFCSVLFLLPDPAPLLAEAWRVLRPNGRILALTPSGAVRVTPALMGQMGWPPHNWTFFLWRQMTKGNGRVWAKGVQLATFARQNGATFTRQPVFHKLAIVEKAQP